MLKKIVLLLLIGFLVNACATVPLTGRKQLALVPNSQLLPLSFDQYSTVLKENKLSNNQEWASMVKRVGVKIQGAVEKYMQDQGLSDKLNGYEWDFNLIDSEVVNAWAMPGGKVAFYTGIMPICKDDAGVAVVMGHEIAHAIANHGGERMSQGLATNGLLGGLSVALGENPTLTQNVFMQALGAGSQLASLKFSRTHESEADKIGLIFMAIAGYDPRVAPAFWTRMDANSSGDRPPEFMSTHPHPATRIADLNAQMPEALKYYKVKK